MQLLSNGEALSLSEKLEYTVFSPGKLGYEQFESLRMLCFLCRKICVKSLDSTRALQHHVTFRDLQEAVDKGCELCELFRTSLLHYYAEDMEGTLEMAEKLHLDLDSQDVDANETDRRVFYLTFIEGRMDAKFGPWGSNIHGLTFTREASSDGVEPVRSVYPFLKLAADYSKTSPVHESHASFSIIDKSKILLLAKKAGLLGMKSLNCLTSLWETGGLVSAGRATKSAQIHLNPNFPLESLM